MAAHSPPSRPPTCLFVCLFVLSVPTYLVCALLAPPGQFNDRYPLLAACEGDRLPCVEALLEARASMSVANVSPECSVPTRVTAIKQASGAAPCNIWQPSSLHTAVFPVCLLASSGRWPYRLTHGCRQGVPGVDWSTAASRWT